MLLSEFSQPRSNVPRLNSQLTESYGRRVPVDASTTEIRRLRDHIRSELDHMVVEGINAQHPDYASKLLALNTVNQLLTQRSLSESISHSANPVFGQVCAALCRSACDCVNVGDDLDHALNKVMDVYRSSRYRFPDAEVRAHVREQVLKCMNLSDHSGTPLFDSQDDHWEAEPDTDAPTASELAQALRSQLDAELTGTVPAAELSQHIDSVAQMYAGIPGTKINSALLSDMTDQLQRRIANSDTEPVAAQHASVTVKLLLADEPEEVQEVVDAMLRRLKLVHPEVFDKHTPEQIAAAVADTARFEAPAADLSKRTVDSWLRYVVSDLREHTAVSEAAPIVAGAAKAFASGAGAAVANRVMDQISETALGEHPVIQRLLSTYGPNAVSAAILDLGDQQQHMNHDELAQEISRRIASGEYDAELPFAVRTQEPHSDVEESTAFMMARQSAVDAGKDHFDFEGETYPVTGDADLSETAQVHRRLALQLIESAHNTGEPSAQQVQKAARYLVNEHGFTEQWFNTVTKRDQLQEEDTAEDAERAAVAMDLQAIRDEIAALADEAWEIVPEPEQPDANSWYSQLLDALGSDSAVGDTDSMQHTVDQLQSQMQEQSRKPYSQSRRTK